MMVWSRPATPALAAAAAALSVAAMGGSWSPTAAWLESVLPDTSRPCLEGSGCAVAEMRSACCPEASSRDTAEAASALRACDASAAPRLLELAAGASSVSAAAATAGAGARCREGVAGGTKAWGRGILLGLLPRPAASTRTGACGRKPCDRHAALLVLLLTGATACGAAAGVRTAGLATPTRGLPAGEDTAAAAPSIRACCTAPASPAEAPSSAATLEEVRGPGTLSATLLPVPPGWCAASQTACSGFPPGAPSSFASATAAGPVTSATALAGSS